MAEIRIRLPHLFTPRSYQLPILHALDTEGKKRGVWVVHRRGGKDRTMLAYISKKMFEDVGAYYHVFPTYRQAKKVVWDGIDIKQGKRFIDIAFPSELFPQQNDTELKITAGNGSIYQLVGSDNFDSIMGTNPIGCVFSEYALQDPRAWDYFRPILAENGGWAVFIYTARGRNHGFKLFQMASKNPAWFCEKLTVEDTKRDDGSPVITPEAIQAERDAGMAEELIQQEFYCSFEGYIQGAYYSKQIHQARVDGRLCAVPHVAGFPVYTFWDLGMDDSTTIWMIQIIGMEIRVIDYYENSGEGLSHYVKVLNEKVYVYGDHYLPHDVEVRELGTGKSRREVLSDLGLGSIITVQRARDIQSVLTGIESGRNIISQCWFDEEKCSRGLLALESYHAEYDEEKKKLENRPVHDWSSHGADAWRTFAVGFERPAPADAPVTDVLENFNNEGDLNGG